MARITVEDCMEVVDNRFELVMMAAKRARQLANGVEPQIDNAENDDKPTVLALREIAGQRDDPLHRRQSGERTVMVFLAVAVFISAFFYPVWTGMNVPYDFWLVHNWMPTWV